MNEYKINSLEEIEQVVDYLFEGGKNRFYEDILDDIIPVPLEENEFIELGDIDIPVFDSDPIDYVAPTYIRQMAMSLCNKVEEEEKRDVIIPNEVKSKEPNYSGSYYESYTGIKIQYEKFLTNEFFQVRDILFFISNRSSSEGIRHTTIFLVGYSWYHFKGIRRETDFVKKCMWLNHFFKPMLSEEEIIYQAKENFKYIVRLGCRTKYINARTIEKVFKPSIEEKAIVRGNYFLKGSFDWKEKKRTEHAKYNLEFYHRKNGYKGKQQQERHLTALKYIEANPTAGVTKICNELGISTTLYYSIIREMNIPKIDKEALVKENPDISFKEFNEITGASRTSYYRYKNKHSK